ncbi:MAG: hypothetical protein V3U75_11550 [Methylococcaceae bacterium]
MSKPYKHLLSKEDLKHMRKNGMGSMYWIKKTFAVQAASRKTSEFEPCYDCKSIANKLKLPT